MSGPDRYLTIDAEVGAGPDGGSLLEVQRSRFLTVLCRVESEDDARAVIEAQRRRHWDANHHCSAFILGADGAIARSNDDGEPAGTAGAPMLAALQRAGLRDVVAVTTRWFGGIKLGTGGLARAYGGAVDEAVAAAGMRTVRRVHLGTLCVEHAEAGRLEHALRSLDGVRVEGVDYDLHTTFSLAVDLAAWPEVRDAVAAATGGRAELEPTDLAWR